MKDAGARLLAISIALSAALFLLLGAAYLAGKSELALAQTVDSLADALTGGALLFALVVSRRPADDNHHFGHQTAQPVAALVVAVLVGVLAVEVLGSAVGAIRSPDEVTFGWHFASVLAAKVLLKLVLMVFAGRGKRSQAMRAFSIDARNDALLGGLSLVGFFAAKYQGWSHLDAYLALPVGLWIFGSGLMLGWESTQLLMGAAPEEERQAALRGVVASVEGVRRVGKLRARHLGDDLDVWVEIFVDPALTVGAAHDLGETIERRLREEGDVASAVVHVDADAVIEKA